MNGPRLVLASKSPARRMLLENAGIPFEARDAAVDETKIKLESLNLGHTPEGIALRLAEAKATAVQSPDTLVLGCDQVLALDGALFDKPATLADAKRHLQSFRGRTHTLISAMVLLQPGAPLWRHTDTASLRVRNVDDAFIDAYLEAAGDDVLASVGAYRLEGRGVQLFERIDGNYFTILGLPLLPLLEELRKRGMLD